MRGDASRRASRTRAPLQLAAPLEVCAAALTALRVSCDRAFGGRKGASCGPEGKAESFHPRQLSHAGMSRSGCCIRGFIFERTHALPCAGVTR